MEVTSRIEELLSPSLKALGYEVVRVQFNRGQRQILQIMIERLDRDGITVDDCADASRAISALLDVEDPISENYDLEVSSPGIDRPLTRFSDFSRFVGFEVKVEMQREVEGRKRFRGPILGTEDEKIILAVDGIRTLLPFPVIRSAKLILTDELIQAAKEERRV